MESDTMTSQVPPAAYRAVGEVSAPSLNYAPGAPVRRRRHIRRIVLLVALLALTAAGWRWGPVGWKHAQFLYWQRQCMNYTMPAGSPAWEVDPVKAAALVKQNQDYALSAGWGGAIFHPSILREYENRGLPQTPWLTSYPPVLLLHGLRSPRGNMRLVVIWKDMHPRLGDRMYCALYIPAGLWSAPRMIPAGSSGDGGYGPFRSTVIWLPEPYHHLGEADCGVGQVDPADPSHFTIPFQIKGKSRIFDGRLMDDDRIVITERNGPATDPQVTDWASQH